MCNNKQRIKTRKEWDNKFGMIEIQDKEEEKVKIEGVGKNAEIVTNAAGGKQSKSPMALHLLDPSYLADLVQERIESLEYTGEDRSTHVDEEDMLTYSIYKAIYNIALYMRGIDDIKPLYLDFAMESLEPEEIQQAIKIAKVLQYGANRYEVNNWRLIPQEEHLNHALIHLFAALVGDTQDNHIDHALCRLMMARATKTSEGFSYTKYVKKS